MVLESFQIEFVRAAVSATAHAVVFSLVAVAWTLVYRAFYGKSK